MEFLITLLISVGIFLGIFIPLKLRNNKYERFVEDNSEALATLKEINSKYKFGVVQMTILEYSYDNENFYNDISCYDYLTYELVYIQEKVNKEIKAAFRNSVLFTAYKDEIKNKCELKRFGTTELLKNKNKIYKIEQKKFGKLIIKPITKFSLEVELTLTNLNGYRKESKYEIFDETDIHELEKRINQKRGKFYLDKDVWDSICRVERGKVSNKMRFSIYKRDNYRCRICGRKTNDLEIDHIIPIAKGGKSTYDNLQTLCHRCNIKKGDKLDY